MDESALVTRAEMEDRIQRAYMNGIEIGKQESVKTESVIKLLEGIIELLKG